ncbi:hypothetical protein H632_c538p2 [Helicosporidium sp. ATCC 50920]|nr:hypothetical protein H632_c538p2 [Helicosporidium sp. ATCC 50920]|eukprot:KDD75711.1 hypothetical protein H632_c538p2 [Helicosporidium sp. ATCC 50920]
MHAPFLFFFEKHKILAQSAASPPPDKARLSAQIKADSGVPAKPQAPARCNAPLPPHLGLYKRAPSSAPSPLPRPSMVSVSELSTRVDSLMALALKQSEALVALTSHVKLLEQRQTSLFSSRAPSEDGAALEDALGAPSARLPAPQAHASPSSSQGALAEPGPGSVRSQEPWASKARANSSRARRLSGGEAWRALIWGLLGAGICALALSLPALRAPWQQAPTWTPV